MYHPTTRVLTTLELLQSHQALSGPALAARLEVDARTVRRYIAMLQDLGIPVEAARGRYGGYRLRPGYKLPPLMFTEDEALATMPAAWSVEVLLETTLEEARRQVSPAVATLEEAPGGVVLRCDVGNLRWIALILARLECPFVVRRPAELREELRRLAADLVALAERGEG